MALPHLEIGDLLHRNWIGIVVSGALSAAAFGQITVPAQNYLRNNSFVNWESPHVHPLDMTPDGTKLLAVNTANNSLEIYTPTNGSVKFSKSIPVGLDPVTVRARTNSEAWVVNVISDSVSIVDLTNGIVTKTLQTNDEPADVVFAGSSQDVAYVSCAQAKTLLEFSATAPSAPLATIVIAGEQPRAMALDKTGRYIYLAIFESGNGTTVLPGGESSGFQHDIVLDSRGPYGGVNAPPNNGKSYKPALNPALPAPIAVSMIAKRTVVGSAIEWLDDNLKDWSAFINGAFAQNGTLADRVAGWDLVDRDVAIIDTTSNSVSYQGGLMNILMAIGVNPGTNEITVVGTDPTNQIRYEPNLQSTFVHVDFGRFKQGGTNTVTDLNPHLNYATKSFTTGTSVKNSLGDPRAIVWNAGGTEAYVTGMGSNNVAIIGPTGARLGLINVGQGPTGLVLSNGFAYVLNKFDASISTINTSSNTVSATTSLYFDPTPAAIKTGRPILYNTQLNSGLGQTACASCHVDARWDRLAWDLGNPAGTMNTLPNVTTDSGNPVTFHPMKGPFLTMTLVDTMQAPALHWRGDRPILEDFEDSFNTLLGGSVASQTQINELRNFLSTISLVPNPNRNLDNSYPTALPVLGINNAVIRTGNAVAGAAEFEGGCRSCHLGETNRGNAYIDTSTAFGVGIRNPPTWKNFYKRTGLWFASPTGSTAGFGFQQDGSFDSTQNSSRSDNLMAFMMSFNGGYPYEPAGLNATNWSNYTHAAVGKQVTLSPSNPTDSTGLLAQLTALGDSGAIGLVAKGGIPGDGPFRGWMYLGNGAWQSDHSGEVDYTAMISSYVTSGATVTFTAVPNESAVRIGIDMDSDGILDADDAQPNIPNVAPTNLAVSGTATSSPVADGNHTAAQAIDGNTMGYADQNSMLITAGGTNDWFQEDLGTNAQINLIQLFNRWDCCANRLADVSVFVSQAPFVSSDLIQTRAQAGVREYFLSGVQGLLAQIPMQAPGRYIRVQLNAAGVPLQLAEVRIIGYPIASIVNPGMQATSVGAAVNLKLQVTNMPASGFSSVVAANLPPGLNISTSTGVISGTIKSTAGTSYTTTVSASGTGVGSPSVTFAWTITNGLNDSPATALPGGAVLCSAENGVCTLPEAVTASIYYGAGSSYYVKTGLTAALPCDNTTFADPDPYVVKSCYAVVTTIPAVANSCAEDGGTCTLPASANDVVFYGAGSSYSYKQNAGGSVNCAVATFGGDPDPGVVKACYAMPMPAFLGAPVPVSLSGFNVFGTVNNGTSPPAGGLDQGGYAYSASLLSGSVNWSGIPFTLAPAGAANAVFGGTISLSPGNYQTLNLLATGVNGGQANQTIVVTYTDGTTSSLVQGFSDWGSAGAAFSGESIAISMAYRIVPGGATQNGPWHAYGYSLALNPAKRIQSVALPNNRNVIVLAMSLSPAATAAPSVTAVNMSSADNLFAIANNGTPVSGIGNDGYAYSANLLGSIVSWSGETFSLGAAAARNAATSTTITLPAGNYTNLSFLATGIYGSQLNQVFTVTYTDGTTTVFTQSLSDWGAPQNFAGESTAVAMAYRVIPSGATQIGPWNVYAYSFALNSSKTVKSLTLPNNLSVVVLAIVDLS